MWPNKAHFAATLLFAIAMSMASGVFAQGAPPGPLAPGPGVQPEKAPPPQARIRVQTNEVVAPVTVTDRSGEMELSLTQQDFHVFEDGVEMPIEHFGVGGEPLSIVLLLESSARIAPMLPAIRKSGVVFAQPVLGQTGEAAILEYDSSAHTLVKFTTDPDPLQQAVDHLEPGDSSANLYDAMQRAISMLEERPAAQRRILLVVGESRDTGSGSTLGEVLRHAQIANVTIYAVGLSTAAAMWRLSRDDGGGPATPPIATGDPRQDEMNRAMQGQGDLMELAAWLIETGKNALGPNLLAVAAESTGGLHIRTMRDRSIEKAMDAIGGELHAQYTIGYVPPDGKPSGYHQIKVTVDKSGLKLRTRPGYYLAEASSN